MPYNEHIFVDAYSELIRDNKDSCLPIRGAQMDGNLILCVCKLSA